MLRRNSLTHSQIRQTRPVSYNRQKQDNVVSSSNGTGNTLEQLLSKQASLTDQGIIKKLSISETIQLTWLDLSHNQIKGQTVFWSAIKQLVNLRRLDLQHNALVHAHLGYLPEQLTELYLNHNYIQELSLNRYLPHLKTLECCHNKLLKISFAAGNPSLESVSVSHNKLSILNTVQLTNLERLEACHNELVVINLNPTIKQVQLRECSLKSLIFMSKLRAIRELDLSGNQLSDVRLNSYLPKLDMELLNLSNNAIKYVQGLEVACPNLRYLYISNNEIYSLKGIYAQLVKLPALEILDLSINEFERNEDKDYIQQIMIKLQGQLTHLKSLNRHQVKAPLDGRVQIEVRQSEMTRTLKHVPRPPRQIEVNNKQNKYLPKNSLRYQGMKSIKYTSVAVYTPEKQEFDTLGNTQRAYSNSNCSQFKESPYRLCADLLASARSNSGYMKAPQSNSISIVADDKINFTLGERQSRCIRQVFDSREDSYNPLPLSILAQKNLNVPSDHYDRHQNVSFGGKKAQNSLTELMQQLKDGLIDLEELSVIPARPILKSERGKDITVKVEDGPELDIFFRLFAHYNKRPDLIKKNTNLSRQSEILSNRVTAQQRSSIGFLRVPQLNGKLFRQVVNGKVPFTNFLCDARKASISHVPCRTSSWHIVVLMGSQPLSQMDLQEGIPIEHVDKFTPVYYIETNDK